MRRRERTNIAITEITLGSESGRSERGILLQLIVAHLDVIRDSQVHQVAVAGERLVVIAQTSDILLDIQNAVLTRDRHELGVLVLDDPVFQGANQLQTSTNQHTAEGTLSAGRIHAIQNTVDVHILNTVLLASVQKSIQMTHITIE